eukprot:359544-Chlamydomonas_euryale.AAC.2
MAKSYTRVARGAHTPENQGNQSMAHACASMRGVRHAVWRRCKRRRTACACTAQQRGMPTCVCTLKSGAGHPSFSSQLQQNHPYHTWKKYINAHTRTSPGSAHSAAKACSSAVRPGADGTIAAAMSAHSENAAARTSTSTLASSTPSARASCDSARFPTRGRERRSGVGAALPGCLAARLQPPGPPTPADATTLAATAAAAAVVAGEARGVVRLRLPSPPPRPRPARACGRQPAAASPALPLRPAAAAQAPGALPQASPVAPPRPAPPAAPPPPPPGALVTVASSWKPGAADSVSPRDGSGSARRSSSGTSAASTSGGAMLASSTTTQRPSTTAVVSGPGCHENSPGTLVHTYAPSRLFASIWSSRCTRTIPAALRVSSASRSTRRVLPLPGGPSSSSGRPAHSASAAASRLRRADAVGTNGGGGGAPRPNAQPCAAAPAACGAVPSSLQLSSTPHTSTKPTAGGSAAGAAAAAPAAAAAAAALRLRLPLAPPSPDGVLGAATGACMPTPGSSSAPDALQCERVSGLHIHIPASSRATSAWESCQAPLASTSCSGVRWRDMRTSLL